LKTKQKKNRTVKFLNRHFLFHQGRHVCCELVLWVFEFGDFSEIFSNAQSESDPESFEFAVEVGSRFTVEVFGRSIGPVPIGPRKYGNGPVVVTAGPGPMDGIVRRPGSGNEEILELNSRMIFDFVGSGTNRAGMSDP